MCRFSVQGDAGEAASCFETASETASEDHAERPQNKKEPNVSQAAFRLHARTGMVSFTPSASVDSSVMSSMMLRMPP